MASPGVWGGPFAFITIAPALAILRAGKDGVLAPLVALVTGPVALWARRARTQRPRLHRAFGYAWVTLMLATAISALLRLPLRPPLLEKPT